MGLNFQFATATQIIFGNGVIEKVPGIVAAKGNRVLLVTGKSSSRVKVLSEKINPKIEITGFNVNVEPTISMINNGVKLGQQQHCDVVVGIGGGSVIDAAKAIAALIPNPGEPLDYLEVVGLGKPLWAEPLPFIAIPTTSGTGAEVTKNAVIKSPGHKVKVSLRSDLMFPDFAIVDPTLTHSMPPELTASTGVDALTHLSETFVSCQSNSFIDMFCREGMKRISRSLFKAYKNGNDSLAREDIAFASMLGGLALANVKLGAVHGFAGPMGGMFSIPHGAVCAGLMSAVMEINIQAFQENNFNIEKYIELAQILTGRKSAKAKDGIVWVKELITDLKIPRLSDFGIAESDFPVLVEKAKQASSMKGNPVVLDDGQLFTILEKSI